MFYDLFKELCDERKISPSRACLNMGLSKSLASKWKATGENPRADALPKIAEYFNVSISYLLGEEKEKPTPISESELDNELIKMLVQLTPDEAEKVAAFAAGLIAARTV